MDYKVFSVILNKDGLLDISIILKLFVLGYTTINNFLFCLVDKYNKCRWLKHTFVFSVYHVHNELVIIFEACKWQDANNFVLSVFN